MPKKKRVNKKRDAQRSNNHHKTHECAICLSIRLPRAGGVGRNGGSQDINERTNSTDIFPVPSRCCPQLFHTECLNRWLSEHSTCPNCRAELVPPAARRPPVVDIQDSDDGFDTQPVLEVPFGWAEFMRRENPPR
jgi:hypothetical protein